MKKKDKRKRNSILKHIKVPLLLSLSSLLLMAGCKGYIEGPALSFRKAETRIVNTWNVSKVIVGNGLLYTGDYRYNIYQYRENRTFKFNLVVGGITGYPVTVEGTWRFINEKESVIVDYENSSGWPSDTLQILRLTNDSFWYTNTSDKEFRLVPESES